MIFFSKNSMLYQSKSSLRKQALLMRRALSVHVLAQKSLVIQNKVLKLVGQYKPRLVLSYAHISHEVRSDFLNKTLLNRGYTLALPKIVRETLVFACVSSYEDLVKSSLGILEPADHCPMCECFEDALIVVPGLLFDFRGYRLGYGKAFYDRFLQKFPRLFSVAVACDFQVVHALPNEAHDQSVQAVITELQSFFL